jgi:hypothetical protein
MHTRESNPGLGRSGKVTPRLEALEERCCPSSVSFHNHILDVIDGGGANSVLVRDDGHGDVRVTLDGRTRSFRGVRELLLNSTTGDDTINYALTRTLTTSELIRLNLGKGNDQVHLDFSKGVSAPHLNIGINGGGFQGSQQGVTAVFGAITNSDLRLAARMGGGWDHVTTRFNGALEGRANVDVNVRGGDYIDGISVRAGGPIGAAARLSVETSTVGLMDTAQVDYTGKLAGHLSIQQRTGRGWDWQESTVNVEAGSTGALLDHVQGGRGSGLLMVNIRDRGSRLRRLDAHISTGGGDHTVVNTPNVRVTR